MRCHYLKGSFTMVNSLEQMLLLSLAELLNFSVNVHLCVRAFYNVFLYNVYYVYDVLFL